MKITLCVEENKTECKESGSDIKAIYQIPHFDLRKLIKNKKSHLLRETKSKIWNGWKIMSRNPNPPLEMFTPSFRECSPFNPEIFQLPPPLLKFWIESQT